MAITVQIWMAVDNHLQESLVVCAFPEHTRPFAKANILIDNLFRSIVGHHLVKSPNFVEIKKGKGIWQEQSLDTVSKSVSELK